MKNHATEAVAVMAHNVLVLGWKNKSLPQVCVDMLECIHLLYTWWVDVEESTVKMALHVCASVFVELIIPARPYDS